MGPEKGDDVRGLAEDHRAGGTTTAGDGALSVTGADSAVSIVADATSYNRTLTITSLAAGSPQAPGQVSRVELLGAPGPLKYTRDAGGLTITLPAQKPVDYAYAFTGPGITA